MLYIGQFEFISAHGRLLQAHTDGEMHASQEVGDIGEEERWHVYQLRDNIVSIQNFRTNRWLCGEPSGRAICNRDSPDIWEEWRLHAAGDQRSVALLGYHGMWLCAQPPGQDTQWGGEVAADRHNAGPWERFVMVPSGQLQGHGSSWFNVVMNAVAIATEVVPIVFGGKVLRQPWDAQKRDLEGLSAVEIRKRYPPRDM